MDLIVLYLFFSSLYYSLNYTDYIDLTIKIITMILSTFAITRDIITFYKNGNYFNCFWQGTVDKMFPNYIDERFYQIKNNNTIYNMLNNNSIKKRTGFFSDDIVFCGETGRPSEFIEGKYSELPFLVDFKNIKSDLPIFYNDKDEKTNIRKELKSKFDYSKLKLEYCIDDKIFLKEERSKKSELNSFIDYITPAYPSEMLEEERKEYEIISNEYIKDFYTKLLKNKNKFNNWFFRKISNIKQENLIYRKQHFLNKLYENKHDKISAIFLYTFILFDLENPYDNIRKYRNVIYINLDSFNIDILNYDNNTIDIKYYDRCDKEDNYNSDVCIKKVNIENCEFIYPCINFKRIENKTVNDFWKQFSYDFNNTRNSNLCCMVKRGTSLKRSILHMMSPLELYNSSCSDLYHIENGDYVTKEEEKVVGNIIIDMGETIFKRFTVYKTLSKNERHLDYIDIKEGIIYKNMCVELTLSEKMTKLYTDINEKFVKKIIDRIWI